MGVERNSVPGSRTVRYTGPAAAVLGLGMVAMFVLWIVLALAGVFAGAWVIMLLLGALHGSVAASVPALGYWAVWLIWAAVVVVINVIRAVFK